MDTNKDYEHPILGVITDNEVEHLLWKRQVEAEVDDDVKKLNEIINHMKLIHEKIINVQDTIDQDVLEVIEELEKFRDEEL